MDRTGEIFPLIENLLRVKFGDITSAGVPSATMKTVLDVFDCANNEKETSSKQQDKKQRSIKKQAVKMLNQ